MELCDIQIGRTPRRDEPKYWNGRHPWASIRDLRDRDILETRESISDEAVSAVMPPPARAGTLLVSFKLTIGRIGLATRDMHHNEAIASIPVRRTDLLERDFLRLILPGIMGREQSNRAVLGEVLNKAKLQNLPIPIPPLEEQRRIVGLLDRAAEIRRRADAARGRARAIIPALFLDMFGNPAINPKGWPMATVGNLPGVELRNGISPSKSGKVIGNVLTLSAITRGSFDPSARKESTFAASLAEDQTVSRSLFLICRGNGNRHLVGQGAFPTSDMPGVAFPDTMIALRIKSTEIAPAYLAAVWSSAHLRAQIDAAAKTTNGTFKISQSAIMKFALPLPPLPLQTAFAERAKRLEATARGLDAAAAKAEAMAAGLSAEVFG